MNTYHPSPEAWELAAQFCNGEIGSDAATQLSALLRHDPSLSAWFVGYMNLHAQLQWEHRARSESKLTALPLEGLGHDATLATALADASHISAAPQNPQVVLTAATDSAKWWTTRFSTVSPAMWVLVASITAAFWIAVFVALSPRMQQQSDLIATTSSPENDTDGSSKTIATLINAQDCQWEATSPRVGDKFLRGGLILNSGVAQVSFSSGVKATIEGPSNFELISPAELDLRLGRIIVTVPATAVGFAVNTPVARVVDLGTEFAVEADTAGRTDVEVITGKVDVSYPSATDAAQTPRRTIRLSAGQAKQFSNRAGAVTLVDLSPRMKSRLAKTPPLITLKKSPHKNSSPDSAARYAAAVMADRPLAYWRLNDGDTGVAVDATGNGHNGSYHRAMRSGRHGIWPDDGCARFLGPDAPGWLEMNDVEIPASFTVELWIRSATPRWNAYGWPLSSRGPHGVVICPVGTGKGWFFLIHDAGGKQRTVGPYGLENIADRFHHYVGAYDSTSDQAWMYFDGKLVMQSANVLGDDRRRDPVRLKFLIGKDDLGENPNTFGEGWVDEVAIYDQALAAEAVQRHFSAADLPDHDASAIQTVPGDK